MLPALAYHFDILPWHLDDMPADEIHTFIEALEELGGD